MIDVCPHAYIFADNQVLKALINKIRNWEAWPFELIYAPLAPVWIWYMIKSRAVWFFTPSNPGLTFGGMEGEPKREMYDMLPDNLYPTTFNVLPDASLESILEQLSQHKIDYPFIVKPEIGGQGILFRKIDEEADLVHYHREVPVEYIVQRMVEYPVEVSVFYIRHPKEQQGRITGFLHKIPLQVTGDGKHTLHQLVLHHPKASKRIGELHSKHKETWETVIPAGEVYKLSYAANHNRGAHFVDLKEHIGPQLLSVFDELSHRINDFYYGRYDIMCESVEGLVQGKNFTILEYNGCGAEPNHFYDTGYSLPQAYREILMHWKALYRISSYNRSTGIEPWPFRKGMDFLRETRALFRVMREADSRIE